MGDEIYRLFDRHKIYHHRDRGLRQFARELKRDEARNLESITSDTDQDSLNKFYIEFQKNPVHAAIKAGLAHGIKNLLRNKSKSLKQTDENGDTLLHFTVMHGLSMQSTINATRMPQCRLKDIVSDGISNILDIFLNAGLDVNVKNKKGETALWYAVRRRMMDVIDYLIAKGADVNAKNYNGENLSHLMVLIHLENKKAIEEEEEDYGYNYLQLQQLVFWDWVFSKGVNVELPNANGETAFRQAVMFNMKGNALALAKYVNDITCTNSMGQNVLYFLVDLVQRRNMPNGQQTSNLISVLMTKGLTVNNVDMNGQTVLHIAAKKKKAYIFPLLLDDFTNVNARNMDGETVLHIAIDNFTFQSETEEIVRTLIRKGADVSLKNNAGLTAVQLAAKKKSEKILRILQESNADFTAITDEGDSLLHLVAKDNEAKIIKESLVVLLLNMGCQVNGKNNDGLSALQVASITGCVSMVRALLAHGADINASDDNNGLTALHCASVCSNQALIEILIKAGANVHAKDARGKSPLHLATCSNGELIQTLVKFGAKINAKDNQGHLPLHDVLLNNNIEVLECLLSLGAELNDLGFEENIPFFESVKRRKVWIRVQEHLVVFKTANIPLARVFNQYIDLNQENLKEIHLQCLKHIDAMKKIRISDKINLYDVLLMNPYRRYTFVMKVSFRILAISPTYFEISFGRYARLLRMCQKESMERRPLVEQAKDAWYKITDIPLPELCLDHVLAHLSNGNLNTMIDGAESIE